METPFQEVIRASLTLTKLLCFTCIIGIDVSDNSSNTTSVRLSWSTLPSVSIDSYSYEVGFAVICSDRDCSSIMLDTLPQNYTSYTNTTNGTVQVNGLIADTCYVFGVRVPPGQWTIQLLQTDDLEGDDLEGDDLEGNSIYIIIL